MPGAAANEGLADVYCAMSSPVPAEPTAMLRAATQGAPRRASEGRLCGPQMHGKYSAAVSEGLVDVYSERNRAIADKCHVSTIA